MVQSVAYIHSLNIVHGDLKPSNWLMDEGVPCLNDLETAKDRGLYGSTATCDMSTAAHSLQTPQFAAAELKSPGQAKSRASDIYSLGVSIELVLCGGSGGAATLAEGAFASILPKMLCQQPENRITARQAENALTPLMPGGHATPVMCTEPPPYWSKAASYDWVSSSDMMPIVQRLLVETTCQNCKPYGIATRVEVHRVWRVENKILWKSYANQRAEIFERNGRSRQTEVPQCIVIEEGRLNDATNEVYLWHGLSSRNLESIAYNGLDERYAFLGGMYGVGSYLTHQWCKALQYARTGTCSIHRKKCWGKYRCECRGEKVILLCRALLGEPYMVKHTDNLKKKRIPPVRDETRQVPYDSHIAQPNNIGGQIHSEYVLFDRKSVYPEFIVSFSCKEAGCSHGSEAAWS
eukprot:NODE_5712_length_1742_cov_4.835294.p1 GENE.NODE_5712_length_1742_cov_4.835294~~NODE_5712_length_1742_cov_4.835294.p1  ORF type:complete len:407 (-),score=98.74 NODE_5712_length_1742_cov_4.835294:300-1520(-)